MSNTNRFLKAETDKLTFRRPASFSWMARFPFPEILSAQAGWSCFLESLSLQLPLAGRELENS